MSFHNFADVDEIEHLKDRIAELEARNEKLEAHVDDLQSYISELEALLREALTWCNCGGSGRIMVMEDDVPTGERGIHARCHAARVALGIDAALGGK